jgi:3-dehydroquinate dehydratase-2
MPVPVFILNGPNLNLLGKREPEVYGKSTLADIEALCRDRAAPLDLVVDFRQTNHEGVLVDWLHEAREAARGVIINPGAYTHTSIALRDAISGIALPVIEVHLSNVFAREPFRHHSYISGVAAGLICGLGVRGYLLALEAMQSMVGGPSKAAR